jgi:hypothetical protein
MLLKGIKVGVLKEGFEGLLPNPNVEVTSRAQSLKQNSRKFGYCLSLSHPALHVIRSMEASTSRGGTFGPHMKSGHTFLCIIHDIGQLAQLDLEPRAVALIGSPS